jgi:hypothetical protein
MHPISIDGQDSFPHHLSNRRVIHLKLGSCGHDRVKPACPVAPELTLKPPDTFSSAPNKPTLPSVLHSQLKPAKAD